MQQDSRLSMRARIRLSALLVMPLIARAKFSDYVSLGLRYPRISSVLTIFTTFLNAGRLMHVCLVVGSQGELEQPEMLVGTSVMCSRVRL